MKIRQAVKSLYAVIISAVLTASIMVLYIFDANYIYIRNKSEFTKISDGFLYDIELVATGNMYSNVSGYCFHTEDMEEYYNFGLNISGKASYINNTLCLVNGEKVYILPSVQTVRADLLSLPQARAISQTVSYNFYAGVQSKFLNFLIPEGTYKVGIIFVDIKGAEHLLMSDKELVK